MRLTLRPVTLSNEREGEGEDEETTRLIILRPIFITVLSVISLSFSLFGTQTVHSSEMTDEDQLH